MKTPRIYDHPEPRDRATLADVFGAKLLEARARLKRQPARRVGPGGEKAQGRAP